MATSNAARIPRQPYESPAYTRPRVSSDTRRRTATRNHVRNVQASYQQPTAAPTQPTIDQQFTAGYNQAGVSGSFTHPAPANTNTAPVRNVQATYQAPSAAPTRAPQTHRRRKKKSAAKKVTQSRAATRAKVTLANGMITGAALTFYSTFQLPFALISTVGLGMAYAVYSMIIAVPGGKYLLPAVTNTNGETFSPEGSWASAVVMWALKVFGIAFDPILLFGAGLTVVIAFALLQLLFFWFIYLVGGIKSLSGSSGGLKKLTFVLACIGIVIPVLNLFPLTLIWTSVVWAKPK